MAILRNKLRQRLAQHEAIYKDTVREYNRGHVTIATVNGQRERLNFWLTIADRHNIRGNK